MTTYNSLTVEDLIVKRLWVEHKRIDTINLGSLVVSDPLYNVGIGTENPELRLDIIGTSAIRIPVGNNTIERPDMSTITNKHGIFRYNSSDKTYETYFLNKWRSLGGSQLELSTESTVNKPTIILNKQGLTTSDAGASIEFKLEDASNPDTLHQKQAQILVKNGGASNTGNIHFQTANGSDSYSDRMVIKKDGKVGIGLNPLSTLHIHEVNTSNNYVASNELGGKLILSYHNDYPAAAISSVTVNSGSYNGSMAFYTWRREGDPESSNIYSDDVGVPAKNIYYNAAGALVEAMRISHIGDVGIGINNPDSKLHIFEFSVDLNKSVLILEKNVNAYGNSTSGAILEFKTQKEQARKNQARIRGIDDVANNGDLGGLGFDYSSGFQGYKEGFRLSSTGYIGVNQQDPKVILDIDDTGAIQLPVGISTQRPSTLRKGMIRYNTTTDQFEGYGAGNAWGSLGGVKDIDQDTYITVSDGTTDTDKIKFWTDSNERMIIDENGYVGIGETSPKHKLHINGTMTDSHFSGLYLMNSGTRSNNSVKSVGIKFNVYEPSTSAVTSEIRSSQDNDGYRLDFYTTYSSTSQNTMTLRDGKLGIGTTSPDEKLEIHEGNIRIIQQTYDDTIRSLMWRNITSSGVRRTFYVAAESWGGTSNLRHLYLGYTESSNLTNSAYTSGAKMTVRADGNVGIGTSSPENKLTVHGTTVENDHVNDFLLTVSSKLPNLGWQGIGFGGYTDANSQIIKNAIIHQRKGNWGRGTLHFLTSNTGDSTNVTLSNSRMCIDMTGNVGIGTDSPGSKLHIKPSSADDGIKIKSHHSSTPAADVCSLVTNSGYGGSLIIKDVNSVTKVQLDSGGTNYIMGNVGIGKTNPGRKLEVAGDCSIGYISGSKNGIWISNSHSSGNYGIAPFIQGVSSGFGTNDIALNPNGGNVGIGTNSPGSYKLRVQGLLYASSQIYSGTSLRSPTYYLDNFIYHTNDNATYLGFPGTGTIFFVTSGSEAMRIDSSRRVGIGTNSPEAKLHVSDSILIDAYAGNKGIFFRPGHTTNALYNISILAYRDGDTSGDTLSINGYDGVTFCTGSNSRNERMRVESNGRVGIATTSPSYILHAKGDIYANGGWMRVSDKKGLFFQTYGGGWYMTDSTWIRSYGTKAIYIYGYNNSQNGTTYRTYMRPTSNASVGGPSSGWGSTNERCSILAEFSIFAKQGYVAASDKRIKKNIIEINDSVALQKIRDISCCWYNYIDNTRGKDRTLGFIAQQVRKHLPEAVKFTESFIPSEMRELENLSWEEIILGHNEKEYKLTTDLKDCSGVEYKFIVCNSIKEDEGEEIIFATGNSDNTFIFEKKWNYVYCFGKKINDFHTLDKQKLFALNFSASQEIDRIQQQEKLKLEKVETEVKILKQQLEIVLSQNRMLVSRLEKLESKVN